MENAHDDLVLMVRLQGIYDRIAENLRRLESPPEEVRQLERENRRRRRELEELERRQRELAGELEEVRRTEAQWQRELEHFQKQKAMVTNEREFTAVINEIDYAERTLREARERRESLEGELAALEEEITARRTARPEEEERHRAVSEAWQRTRDELEEAIHELLARARELEDRLSPPNRSRFRRLLESKHGTPLAPVVEGACSFCHFQLRPHLQQRVRRAQEIIQCEHCHRILYLPELPAFQAAAGEG